MQPLSFVNNYILQNDGSHFEIVTSCSFYSILLQHIFIDLKVRIIDKNGFNLIVFMILTLGLKSTELVMVLRTDNQLKSYLLLVRLLDNLLKNNR